MKIYIFTFISLMTLLLSCSTILPPATQENSINLQLQRYNSDMDYDTEIQDFELEGEIFNWFGNPGLGVSLFKDYSIKMTLQNGVEQVINISFYDTQVDPEELDVIGKNGDENFWHFTDTETAKSSFYSKLEGIRITINNSVVFITEENGLENLVIEEVTVEGEEMLLLTLEFETFTYGWYDPDGEWSEYYEIKNAAFSLLTKP
ncbi:hypothetical protein N9B82_05780 [Saprospiraceae bacterium]|nr:hypothetical protein [Saprospiraceae bacterium]